MEYRQAVERALARETPAFVVRKDKPQRGDRILKSIFKRKTLIIINAVSLKEQLIFLNKSAFFMMFCLALNIPDSLIQ